MKKRKALKAAWAVMCLLVLFSMVFAFSFRGLF